MVFLHSMAFLHRMVCYHMMVCPHKMASLAVPDILVVPVSLLLVLLRVFVRVSPDALVRLVFGHLAGLADPVLLHFAPLRASDSLACFHLAAYALLPASDVNCFAPPVLHYLIVDYFVQFLKTLFRPALNLYLLQNLVQVFDVLPLPVLIASFVPALQVFPEPV